MADDGKWPPTLRRFLYDLMPASKAPAQDGIVAPAEDVPTWLDHVAGLQGSREIVQRARESAEARASTAEDKAARLVQIDLALLTITLALGSYQLTYALKHSVFWLISLLPVGCAIVCLSLTAFEALQIDRVGVYSMPTGEELDGATATQMPALLLSAEVRGERLASWTANKKHSDLMQARAWMTRGLAALLMAGILAGVARALPEPASTRNHSSSFTGTAGSTAHENGAVLRNPGFTDTWPKSER